MRRRLAIFTTALLALSASASDVIVVERDAGGFISVEIPDRAFVVRFLNSAQKPVMPEVSRGSVRWRKMGEVEDEVQEFLVLRPKNGALRSPDRVYPPHNFVAFINLLDESGVVRETYRVDLRELIQRRAEAEES